MKHIKINMRYLTGIVALLLASFAWGTDDKALAEHPGAELYADNCTTSCHSHETSDLYTRAERKATDRAELSKWVSRCLSQLKIEMFPDEEEEVEEYLNAKYYKY